MSNVSYTKIIVRYAETDKMGISHHSIYPVWYEVARTEFIKTLGVSYSEIEESGVMLPLTNVECNFKGTCTYEDEITIKTEITKLSVAKITFSYTLYKNGEEKPFNFGSTSHGFVSSSSFRPMNLKKYNESLYLKLQNAME